MNQKTKTVKIQGTALQAAVQVAVQTETVIEILTKVQEKTIQILRITNLMKKAPLDIKN